MAYSFPLRCIDQRSVSYTCQSALLGLVKARDRLLGIRVAGIGGLLVPLARLAEISADAPTVLIQQAQVEQTRSADRRQHR